MAHVFARGVTSQPGPLGAQGAARESLQHRGASADAVRGVRLRRPNKFLIFMDIGINWNKYIHNICMNIVI